DLRARERALLEAAGVRESRRRAAPDRAGRGLRAASRPRTGLTSRFRVSKKPQRASRTARGSRLLAVWKHLPPRILRKREGAMAEKEKKERDVPIHGQHDVKKKELGETSTEKGLGRENVERFEKQGEGVAPVGGASEEIEEEE